VNLQDYKIIFWDFDGVIKDSVQVKTNAYLDLFSEADPLTKKKIKEHHLQNGGMSRFIKIPIYMEWNQIEKNDSIVKGYLEKFAKDVAESVISSPWIAGVEEVISKKLDNQIFVIVTGTPQDEIDYIIYNLKLNDKFDRIFGSPSNKADVIKNTLTEYQINRIDALMIGDSESDFIASDKNGIDFLFCETGEESEFSKTFIGKRIKDFKGYL
jgi:phosphoglycolate phosphatase-like HAD superfamily hydrolase